MILVSAASNVTAEQLHYDEIRDHLVSNQDVQARIAQDIFSRLLTYWSGQTPVPKLFVVDAKQDIWAASLADGNIVISKRALQISLQADKSHFGGHLAFVLAHELAHQLSDDLWTVRFFDESKVKHQADQENKADAQALILMSLAGFDPLGIIGEKDFFSYWTLHRWGFDCSRQKKKLICQNSITRVRNNRNLMKKIVSSLVLFDLGNQALVAGQYRNAQEYYRQFARFFPSPSVYNNLATTYLLETLQLYQQLVAMGETDFFMQIAPLMDHKIVALERISRSELMRDGNDPKARIRKFEMLRAQLNNATMKAIENLKQALKMQPNSQNSYVNLIFAYIVNGKTSMALGYVKDEYIKRFGTDVTAEFLEVLIKAKKSPKQCHRWLVAFVERHVDRFAEMNPRDKSSVVMALKNLDRFEVIFGKPTSTRTYWVRLARQAQKSDALNFAIARLQLNKTVLKHRHRSELGSFSLGEKVTSMSSCKRLVLPISMARKALTLCQRGSEHIALDDAQRVVAVWGGTKAKIPKLKGLLRRYGLPTRQLFTDAAQYWAYDSLNLGFYVVGDSVQSWFKYPSP